MENETQEVESFGKTLTKVFAVNAVATAGALAGLVVVGIALGKLNRKKVIETPDNSVEA